MGCGFKQGGREDEQLVVNSAEEQKLTRFVSVLQREEDYHESGDYI